MLILPFSAGDTITLRVLRDSSTEEVDVTLGELPG
jgi:S1-C subfamily serine protease